MGYVSDETHSVGLLTGVMICRPSISFRVFIYFFSVVYRDFAPSVLYRGTVESRQMEYSPGMLPTASKELGNAFLSVNMSVMSANHKWS